MNEVEKLKFEVARVSRQHALLEQRVAVLQKLLGMHMEYRKVGEVDSPGNFHSTPCEPARVV